ncbi:hypothetical protein Tco_0527199 [Tanacetum coccineum]
MCHLHKRGHWCPNWPFSEEIQSSSAMNSNPSQPQASTLVVAGMHKEVQQATSSPTSLGVTSEEAHPQLSSASTIIHSESASKHDVSACSKAGADSGLSAPKDSIS